MSMFFATVLFTLFFVIIGCIVEKTNAPKFEDIVEWMVEIGTKYTDNGSWIIYPDEIAEEFGVTERWVTRHYDDIVDILDCREEIIDVTCGKEDNCFDMMFCLSSCIDWDGTPDWGCAISSGYLGD